jgi:hypothetical protein
VDRRENDSNSGEERYYLRFPNFEVESAIYYLTLGVKISDKNLSLLHQQAAALLASFINMDPPGVQLAFSSILCLLPYTTHSPYEGHYQAIFLLALGLAYQPYETESASGKGILDVQFQAANGDNYIIELKYVSGLDAKTKEEISPDTLQKRMEKAALEALDQIEKKKYTFKFQGQGNNIYKTALIIGDQTDVLVVFEKAENWHLVRNILGVGKVQKI